MATDITDHDRALARRQRGTSRFRAMSPGWAAGCRGCRRNERLCAYERTDCPDDADAMRREHYRTTNSTGD